MINSRAMMKMELNKRILNKKQISVDLLNINKNIKEELNSRINGNNFNILNYNNNITKKDSFEFKNDISSNINVIDNSNVNININKNVNNNVIINNINENRNKFNNIVNNRENNNINILNNLNEINLFNKIKKRNISNSSFNEKQIIINSDKLEKLGQNINKSYFDYKKFKRKKLNIFSLCGERQTKELNIEEKKGKDDNKILPIVLPPLNKSNNKNSINQSQNMPPILPNIKYFNFNIIKKKRIKHINFNQNKIIENSNKTNEEQESKPVTRLLSKIPPSINIRKYVDNEKDNDNKINNNNGGHKSQIYIKFLNNEKLKIKKLELGKSQSTELFPKIKIT